MTNGVNLMINSLSKFAEVKVGMDNMLQSKLLIRALLVLLLRYLKRDQVNQMVPLQITPKGYHVLG